MRLWAFLLGWTEAYYRKNGSISTSFYSAAENVDQAYQSAHLEFEHNKWTCPKTLFQYFKRPQSTGTEEAVRRADIFTHTLDLILDHHEINRGPRIRKRRERVTLTDILDDEQRNALINFSGCRLNKDTSDACPTDCKANKYRSIDGLCNNRAQSEWGASNMPFKRLLNPIYQDDIGKPLTSVAGRALPLVREVSNSLAREGLIETVGRDEEFNHIITVWGQYVDHDMDITPQSKAISAFQGNVRCETTCENLNPCFPIQLPSNDPKRLGEAGRQCLPFFRSASVCGTGSTSALLNGGLVREQINAHTSFVDASTVYGFSKDIESDLRAEDGLMIVNTRFDDNGKDYLPFSKDACVQPPEGGNLGTVPCFKAGDPRSSEVLPLASIHTIFLRLHNKFAKELKEINRHWSGEQIYQETRMILSAIHQKIHFEDYLPLILGPNWFNLPYNGYDPNVDATISNIFATAAFRFGHGAIRSKIFRLNEFYQESSAHRNLDLHEAFFSPWRAIAEGGFDPIVRGILFGQAKKSDPNSVMSEELRDKLFKLANKSGFDLASLNLQRGRDHGLPLYGDWKEKAELLCGQNGEIGNFGYRADQNYITDSNVIARLTSLYGSLDNVDIWIAGLLEDLLPGARVGPTFQCLLIEQFNRLRIGDRFYYQNYYADAPQKLAAIQDFSMSKLICMTTGIDRVPSNAFRQSSFAEMALCSTLGTFDLSNWREDSTQDGCGVPRSPENGFVSFCSEMDRSIEYGCNPGYSMVGERKSATCQDGRWSPAAPACVDIDECITKPGICGESQCINKMGGFECMEDNDEPMVTDDPNENRPMLIALLVIVSILFAMFVVIAALFILHSKRTSNVVKPTKTRITVMPEIDSSTSSTIGDRSFKSEKSLISNN